MYLKLRYFFKTEILSIKFYRAESKFSEWNTDFIFD